MTRTNVLHQAPSVLEVFPGFLILARLGHHPLIDRTFTITAAGVQSVLLVHFLHGGWVA